MGTDFVEIGIPPTRPPSASMRRLRAVTSVAIAAGAGFLAYPVVNAGPEAAEAPDRSAVATASASAPAAGTGGYGLHPTARRWCHVAFAPGLITDTRCFGSKAAYVRWLRGR